MVSEWLDVTLLSLKPRPQHLRCRWGRFTNGTASFAAGALSAFPSDTVHSIDLMRWIAGGTAMKCALVESQHDDVVPNSGNAVIKFDNGVTGIVKANYRTGGRVHTFEIHGPGASAYINLGFGGFASEAKILYSKGKGNYSLSAAGPDNFSTEVIDGTALGEGPEEYMYYGFYHEDVDFLRCVAENKKPMCDITEGVATMKLVEELLRNTI